MTALTGLLACPFYAISPSAHLGPDVEGELWDVGSRAVQSDEPLKVVSI
jgi:hypothetical protein